MSTNISVTVQSANASPTTPAPYQSTITINSSNGITKYLFVKQRSINLDSSINDKYIDVADPADIANLPQQEPNPPNNLWRDSTVTLVSSNPNWLDTVVQDILTDLLLTVQQTQSLTTFTASTVYTIDSSAGIT